MVEMLPAASPRLVRKFVRNSSSTATGIFITSDIGKEGGNQEGRREGLSGSMPPKIPKPKFKKHGFCMYYDIKSFT
jgi:hypothetical protein